MRRLGQPLAAGVLVAASVALVAAGSYRPTEQGPALALLVAGLAATASGLVVSLAVIRPWWGLLAFVGVAPVINVARAELSVGPIQVIPATLVVLALAIGVALGRRSASTRHPATGRGAWAWLAIGAALATASTIASPAPDAAWNITLHGVLEPMALFGIVLALRPEARHALQALLALASSVVLATLINLVWLLVVVAPTDFYEQRMQLARLTYFNVGIFAAMLVMAIPATATLLLRQRPWRWAWLAIGLFLVALFLTYTKSAWLSAAMVSALLIVLLVRTWRGRAGLLLGVAAVLAIGVPYPLPVLRAVAPALAATYESFIVGVQGSGRLESWDPDTYQGSGSIGIRLEAIGAAAEMTATAPLLGVGPGRFGVEFARIRPDASVPNLQSAHNLLPNLAAEYGLPFALLVAVGLAFLIGATLVRARAAPPELRLVATVVGASLVGFAAMATLFGVDLYRTYRTMNTDVLTAALLAGLAWCLVVRPADSLKPSAGG
jgi:hypothetical protein